jgi:hypothetical protein
MLLPRSTPIILWTHRKTARSPYLIGPWKRWREPTHRYMGTLAITMQKIAYSVTVHLAKSPRNVLVLK